LLCNARIKRGEQIRVFPISNWTELDVWRYIEAEQLELPSLYFAHRRRVIERDGILLAESDLIKPEAGEHAYEASVRYRTIGDMTVTGAVASEAADVATVIAETAAASISERGQTRADDRVSEAAMEDRKREGYF
jgi:sulfate adenylyltransferase subunit 2